MNSTPHKSECPGGAGQVANRSANGFEFSSKSTATEVQRGRILAALRRGPKTSYELRCLGIYQGPARIKELRDHYGFDIVTDRISLVDGDGYWHRGCALYTLRESGVTQ